MPIPPSSKPWRSALELPYQKDREGLLLMRQMSRPRKPRKGEDKSVLHWVFDAEKLARLVEYCAQDVRTTRAVWQPSQAQAADRRRAPLSDPRRHHQSARRSRRSRAGHQRARPGGCASATRINAALHGAHRRRDHLGRPGGRILAYAVERGHAMTSVGRRSVSAVLAAEPDEATRTVLELRRDGARASVRKYERILAYAGEADDRMRGTMRMYGGGPGRWSGRGPQLQNLKKNESNIPLAAVDAVRTGDRARLRQYGNPLTVLGDIARATVCAAPGNVLMAADFGAIESRILAWLSGEEWKLRDLSRIRSYERQGEGALSRRRGEDAAARTTPPASPRRSATRARPAISPADSAARSVRGGASFPATSAPTTRSSSTSAPGATPIRRRPTIGASSRAQFAIAIRTGQPFAAGKIVASFENGNLYLTLPSGPADHLPAGAAGRRASSRTATPT